ncbi:uncharacterized protein LOC142605814 [Castanea sativa]|uniref:uncharacterized protein LOC142605814 n=1 Tax=Castanea sativa TaxID=21020 RepID=UPI003F64CE7A
MRMGSGETFRLYANRYWELYKEKGGNEQVVASTFRLGLPQESELRDSLTMRPPENMHQLIRRIEELEKRTRREPRVPNVNVASRPESANIAFKEPVYRILKRIKNELEKGHTTKQCRVLKDHLEQLVKAGHLKEFVVRQEGGNVGQGSGSQGNNLPPPLGIIEVINAAFIGVNVSHRRGILSVATLPESEVLDRPEKRLRLNRDLITFDEDNLEGTLQPHDDALVVTSWIGGFLVKRVMID